jgi:aminoglycoside phosphotransferase (APT) family kinase protein
MSLHDDEVTVTADDVRRLVSAQLPHLADLPVTPVAEAGTDHRLFRLGDDLVARMPKISWSAGHAARDAEWLPRLAPSLPLTLPAPVAVGEPDDGYPFQWSVVPWLRGAAVADPLDPAATPNVIFDVAAVQLGEFVTALRGIDRAGGPTKEGGDRGGQLSQRDDDVRKAIADCGDRIDGPAALKAWDRVLEAGDAERPGAWIHGDLLPGNLIAEGNRLTGVIDWGALGVGDPAVDLMPAWMLFSGRSRETFREAAGLDDAAWERGRGWLLIMSTFALPYYWDRWPEFALASQRRIEAIIADVS